MSSDLSAAQVPGTLAGPLIFGHRGAAGLVPENTLPSFQAALELGVDGVELDVYFAHQQLWVIHDDTLERTTNGRGGLLDYSAAALRQLDAGASAPIPLLEEVLACVPDSVLINIELKGPQTAAPVLAATAHRNPQQLLISSFDHAQLTEYRALGGAGKVGVLIDRWHSDAIQTAQRLSAWSINLAKKIVTARRTERIHQEGFRVLSYTVNNLRTARRLVGYGVDGLFTDRPDRISSDALTD